MLATCPNMNPPVITTGVGPHGRKIIYTQPPEGGLTDNDAADGILSTTSSGVFDEEAHAAPAIQHQYRNLLEAMAAVAQVGNADTQPQAPADPPHMEPLADKENTVPPSTPSNTFSSSSYAKAMIEKAKSNVKKLPPYVVFLCRNSFLIGRLHSDNMSITQL